MARSGALPGDPRLATKFNNSEYIFDCECQQSPLSNQPIWDATINVKVLSLQWAAFTVMTRGWKVLIFAVSPYF